MNPLANLTDFISRLRQLRNPTPPSQSNALRGLNMPSQLQQDTQPIESTDKTQQALQEQSDSIMGQTAPLRIHVPYYGPQYAVPYEQPTARPIPTVKYIQTTTTKSKPKVKKMVSSLKDVAQMANMSSPVPFAAGPVRNDVINPLIQKYFPRDQWINAQRVMLGESGGRANAIGDNYPIAGQTIPSYGLFQIRALPGRPAPQQLLNPEFNVKYAAQLLAQQGGRWSPTWTAATKQGIL